MSRVRSFRTRVNQDCKHLKDGILKRLKSIYQDGKPIAVKVVRRNDKYGHDSYLIAASVGGYCASVFMLRILWQLASDGCKEIWMNDKAARIMSHLTEMEV